MSGARGLRPWWQIVLLVPVVLLYWVCLPAHFFIRWADTYL